MQQGLSEVTSPPFSSTPSSPSLNSTRIPPSSASGGEGGVVETFNHDRGVPGAQSFDEESMMEVDGGREERQPWQEEEEGGVSRMDTTELPSFRFDDDDDSEGEMNR